MLAAHVEVVSTHGWYGPAHIFFAFPLFLGSMTLSPDPAAAKRTLREQALARRRVLARDGGIAAAEALADRVTAEEGLVTTHRGVVAGYWPLPGELDPRPLMARLAACGLRLALPVVVARDAPLDFRAWAPGDVLEPGPLGTRHPAPTAEALRPDWLLVPLLAFDRTGYRLGFGGGFYDRTLARLRGDGGIPPFALGIAFDGQATDSVPVEGHDRPLDAVATPTTLIRFPAAGAI